MEERTPFWWPDMAAIITLMLVISSGTMLYAVLFKYGNIPENDVVKGLIGAWFTLTTQAVYRYFGSTTGSRAKDETAAVQAQTIAQMTVQNGGPKPTIDRRI